MKKTETIVALTLAGVLLANSVCGYDHGEHVHEETHYPLVVCNQVVAPTSGSYSVSGDSAAWFGSQVSGVF